MSDAKQVIADVLAGHDHWDYAGALHCRCGAEFEGCTEEAVKGWGLHLAEMVDAALGGLTREISQVTRNCSYPGGGGPCEGKHHGRWVTDWTPEERSVTDD